MWRVAPSVRRLLASVRSVMSELHSMEEVEAPPRLVYSILDNTLGPRENGYGLADISEFHSWFGDSKVRIWCCQCDGHVDHPSGHVGNLAA